MRRQDNSDMTKAGPKRYTVADTMARIAAEIDQLQKNYDALRAQEDFRLQKEAAAASNVHRLVA